MVKIICFTFIFLQTAFAIEGTITALEAPIFGEPNDKTKVIQYVRKGSKIFIHDAEAYVDPYRSQNFKHAPEKFEIINKDLFITDESIYKPSQSSKFYKTLAKSGREAYILKEHVFIDYRDTRELTQKVQRPDNTDYRIEEPISDTYPFLKEHEGYRGQTTFALGQPNYRAYPYKEDILDTAFSLSKEFQFVYTIMPKDFNYEGRLFFGFVAGLHFSEQQYVLTTQIAKQANSRFYVGPHLSYDFFRNEKLYISAFTSMQVLLYDTMEISIENSATDENDRRTYQSFLGLQPNIGANLNFPRAVLGTDGVIGFNVKGLLPKTYSANNSGSVSSFWRETDTSDSFKQPFRVELSYFIGIQSVY